MSDDALMQLRAARSDEERELVVLDFSLAALGSALREAFEAAAIPHWFNDEYLAALLLQRVEDVRPLVARLAALSFVKPFARGHDLHERIRALLLRRLWHDDRARFVELSGRAEQFCAAQDMDDPGWRIERVYHALAVEPKAGVKQMGNAVERWLHDYQYERCEAMVRAAREHADAGRLREPAIAWTWYFQGITDRALDRPREAQRALLRIEADANSRLAVLRELNLGNAYMDSSNLDEAMEHFEAAIRLVPKDESSSLEGDALFGLSAALQTRDDYPAAAKRLAEARVAFDAKGDRIGAAICMRNLAGIYRILGEFRSGRAVLDEAIQITRAENDWSSQGEALLELALYHLAYGEAELAISQINKALTLFQRSHSLSGEARCEKELGNALRDLGRHDEARGHYDKGLAISRAIKNRQREAYCISGLGYLDLAVGEPGQAHERLGAALEIFRAVGDRVGQAECALGLSDVEQALGEPGAAQSYLQEALSIYGTLNARPGIADALLRLGDLRADVADWAGAQVAYCEAAGLYAACELTHKSALASQRGQCVPSVSRSPDAAES